MQQIIKDRIINILPDAEVIINSDDNVHFNAIVVSDTFKGKNLLARQRVIYKVLSDDISSGKLHAISLKTYSKDEYIKG